MGRRTEVFELELLEAEVVQELAPSLELEDRVAREGELERRLRHRHYVHRVLRPIARATITGLGGHPGRRRDEATSGWEHVRR